MVRRLRPSRPTTWPSRSTLPRTRRSGSNLLDYVAERDRHEPTTSSSSSRPTRPTRNGPSGFTTARSSRQDLDAKFNNADILKNTQQERRWHRPVHVTRRPPRTAWSGSRTTTGGRPRPSTSNVQPKYIVDIVNSSNNVALGQLLAGGLDLDNNYLPGIARSSRAATTSLPTSRAPRTCSRATPRGSFRTPRRSRLTTRPSARRWRRRSTPTNIVPRSTATSSPQPTRPASCRPGASTSMPLRSRRSASTFNTAKAKADARRQPATRLALTGSSRTRTARPSS